MQAAEVIKEDVGTTDIASTTLQKFASMALTPQAVMTELGGKLLQISSVEDDFWCLWQLGLRIFRARSQSGHPRENGSPNVDAMPEAGMPLSFLTNVQGLQIEEDCVFLNFDMLFLLTTLFVPEEQVPVLGS